VRAAPAEPHLAALANELVFFADGADGAGGAGAGRLPRAAEVGARAAGVADDAWHVALYVSDFAGTFARAAARGLVWDNLRFSDACGGDYARAAANGQFRARELGAGGPVLELEIRATWHAAYPLRARSGGGGD